MSINYIDLLVIVVLLVSVFIGFKKGFLKTVTGLLAVMVSLILAITLHPYVSEYLEKTPVYDTVYNTASSVLITPKETTGKITDYGAGNLNLPREFTNNMQETIETAKENTANKIAQTVAKASIKIISMLLIFIVARLLFFVVTLLAGIIKKLPLIGWGDSLLGALLGLIRGFLIVYIIFMAFTILASFSPENEWVRTIKYSEFAKILYNDNVLLDFIYKG